MTALVDTAALGNSPLRVSVEGINGVGKTSASRSAAIKFGTRCRLLDELTDQATDTLPGQVISALSIGRDPFLRTGHPIVETLALLGLQVRKTECLGEHDLAGVDVILEDRGVDTVAVYQAVILSSQHPEASAAEVARHILATYRRWAAMPDATILLTGDLPVCAQRFAARLGQALDPKDLRLLEQIDILYRSMAEEDPGRYTVLDLVGLPPDGSAGAVVRIVETLLEQRELARA